MVMALLELGLVIFGFILFIVLWLMHFMSIIYVRLHLNRKMPDKPSYSKLVGVSLLKPLKGVDPNLISNLETFFELDYPKALSGADVELAGKSLNTGDSQNGLPCAATAVLKVLNSCLNTAVKR
ncbi:hypothetical protein GJAV_G00027120 [Gymnothorax javanicus]|nr:hypothetical protein GJAV_G00027120 [Gymnothorax javanicus]